MEDCWISDAAGCSQIGDSREEQTHLAALIPVLRADGGPSPRRHPASHALKHRWGLRLWHEKLPFHRADGQISRKGD